jgi:TPR repeat protein
MNIRRLFRVGILLAVAQLALSEKPGLTQTKQKSPNEPVMLNQDLMIPDEERSGLEKAALAGSQEAAIRLANGILFGDVSTKEKYLKGVYWLQIAVENGSNQSIYNLGATLSHLPEPLQQIRARYWLNRAVAECPKPLSEYAEQILIEMH